MRLRPLLAALGVTAALLAPIGPASSASAADDAYAPLDRPGPALTVTAAQAADATECHGDLAAGPKPVLLNPATSVTPEENYSWNWERAFRREGRPYCTVTMPFHTFGDIQVAAEYLVRVTRTMHAEAGRPIAVMGHSQGGMSMRWALRFWPDLRPMVDEVIGMAPSNHGTTMLVQCVPGVTTCTPAVWQQGSRSHFIAALNSRAETFAGIDYTNTYTALDEVVRPPSSSSLTTGGGEIANISLQSICPADPYEHVLSGTVSPTTYAIVMDALTHDGPARADRVDRSACGRLYMPGVTPADVASFRPMVTALPQLLTTVVPDATLSGAPLVRREPALRCYVYAAGC